MAGYSGTPLPKKLGIKEQSRVALVGIPADVTSELQASLKSCRTPNGEPIDFAMVFVKSTGELKNKFAEVAGKLAPAGMLWVSWPKKTSGVATDLDENKVRDVGLAAGLVDVKVCAVNDVWSGLKFVIRIKDRPKS
jgi:hypothetical protein